MKKYNFNMVEIALAMVIISIGITGILGLFSVGVNARKAAISENNIADAAEYTLGLYRALILEKYTDSPVGEGKNAPAIVNGIPTANAAVGSDGTSLDISGLTGTATSHIYTGSGTSVTNFNVSSATALPETFVYAPSRLVDGVRIADCEIAGSIWKTQIPVTFLGASSKVDMPYSYGVRIYLELSWPLEQKYENRDKKIFVMDIVNPKPVLAAKSQGGE